jgi:hypothetical protein
MTSGHLPYSSHITNLELVLNKAERLADQLGQDLPRQHPRVRDEPPSCVALVEPL